MTGIIINVNNCLATASVVCSPMALKSILGKVFRCRQLFTSNYSYSISSVRLSAMAEHPVKDIKFESLKDKLLSRNITLIDVREPNELKDDGKIPNSVNIPLAQIAEAFQLPNSEFVAKYGIDKPAETDNFVISCRSGKRATNAFNKILPLGFKNAMVYTGSFQDWVKNGGPIEK